MSSPKHSRVADIRRVTDRLRTHGRWSNYPGTHHHGVPLDDVTTEDFDAGPKHLCVADFRQRGLNEGGRMSVGVINASRSQ